jgi:hypothetical protein
VKKCPVPGKDDVTAMLINPFYAISIDPDLAVLEGSYPRNPVDPTISEGYRQAEDH